MSKLRLREAGRPAQGHTEGGSRATLWPGWPSSAPTPTTTCSLGPVEPPTFSPKITTDSVPHSQSLGRTLHDATSDALV